MSEKKYKTKTKQRQERHVKLRETQHGLSSSEITENSDNMLVCLLLSTVVHQWTTTYVRASRYQYLSVFPTFSRVQKNDIKTYGFKVNYDYFYTMFHKLWEYRLIMTTHSLVPLPLVSIQCVQRHLYFGILDSCQSLLIKRLIINLDTVTEYMLYYLLLGVFVIVAPPIDDPLSIDFGTGSQYALVIGQQNIQFVVKCLMKRITQYHIQYATTTHNNQPKFSQSIAAQPHRGIIVMPPLQESLVVSNQTRTIKKYYNTSDSAIMKISSDTSNYTDCNSSSNDLDSIHSAVYSTIDTSHHEVVRFEL